ERADEKSQRRFIPTVIHGSPNAFDKLVEWPGSIAEHLHLFARLGQVSGQQNVFLFRDLLAPAKKIFRSRGQSVRCEAPRCDSFDFAAAFANATAGRQDRLMSCPTE